MTITADSGGENRTAGGGGGDELSAVEAGGGHQFNLHHLQPNHKSNPFLNQARSVMLLFAAVALSCVVLYRSAYPFGFLTNSYYDASTAHGNLSLSRDAAAGSAPAKSSPLAKEEDYKLKEVLKKAAMVDKTVIITALNDAWAEPNSIFDLFLESFRIGNQTQKLLNHLVVVALDQKAYARCTAIHPYCYFLSTNGTDFSAEAYFMTSDYLKMMWRRIDFLHTVLDMGYSFVFTDADIMWFRDPFPHIYSDTDFQIACDYFRGNPSDLNNQPNGGFNYVKSSTRTIKFYEFWYASRETFPGKHDQDVLNMIKFDPFFRKIGLQMKFLDTAYFGGFCEPSKDLNLVCTMHANCCVGLDNKVHDLRIMLDDWRKYMSPPAEERASKPPSWTVPQHCGAASFRSHEHKKNDKKGNNSR